MSSAKQAADKRWWDRWTDNKLNTRLHLQPRLTSQFSTVFPTNTGSSNNSGLVKLGVARLICWFCSITLPDKCWPSFLNPFQDRDERSDDC